MSFIDIENIDLVYRNSEGDEVGDGTLALADASLQMEKGEFIALVGPSGCGKSTLLKVVAGLIRANKGKVVVAGQEVTKPLKIVGMAFQNATLLPLLARMRPATTFKSITLWRPPLEFL